MPQAQARVMPPLIFVLPETSPRRFVRFHTRGHCPERGDESGSVSGRANERLLVSSICLGEAGLHPHAFGGNGVKVDTE